MPSSHTPQSPLQLSFPLPHAPQTRVHIHLTATPSSILLFLTTSSTDASTQPSQSTASMGSFVYALPNRSGTGPPLSTALYPQSSTQDFATRVARILAARTRRPVYVGNSVSLAGAGRGGDVEEETAALRRIVDVVIGVVGGTVKIGER